MIRTLLLFFICYHTAPALLAQETLVPLQKPDRMACQAAKQNRLKVALRFGYIADNREAGSLRSRTEYNGAGRPLVVYDFNDEGQISKKSEYTYGPQDTAIRVANIEEYDASSELVYARRYVYNPQGLLQEYRVINVKSQEFRLAYTYDARANLLSEQTFEPGGLPGPSTVYTYNPAGQCTEKVAYDLGTTVKRRTAYRYDAQGRKVEEAHFLQSSLKLFRLTFSYDDQGRLARQDRFSRQNKPIGFESWQYNAKGQVSEHLVQEPGEAKPLRETTTYDAQGRKNEFISYDVDGSIFQWFKYEYDRTGSGEGYRRLQADGSVDMHFQEIYDTEGRIKARNTLFPDGSGDLKISFRYDDGGLPMEEIHTSFAQESATYWFVFERY